MPTFEVSSQPPEAVEADVLAVFVGKSDDAVRLGADGTALGERLEVDLADESRAVRFDGDLGSVARVPTRGRARAGVLLVVGLGEDPDLHALRKAAGAAAKQSTKDATLAVVVPGDLLRGDASSAQRAQAAVEGTGLGAYAFTNYRTKQHDLPSLERVVILAGEQVDDQALEEGLQRGRVLVRATSLARDLVNEPPAGKRPPALADRVARLAAEVGLSVKVMDEQELASGSFGGIVGVGQGSTEPPRLVELTYEPDGGQGHVVLVGKGITFDSGGLSLKPSEAMSTMKSDMSGAAAVVGAMSALSDLGVPVKVTGLLALAENMPSGAAIRVSDVLTHRNGRTVEVMNTDAEGRLVLADALAYGAEAQPDAMIDLATLTGAQIVALGSKIAGLMGSDDELVAAVKAAAEDAGEQVWHLPLPGEYREHLDSEVADLKNIGRPREAGTLIGGLFLKEFIGDVPWAHLDIAGPAFDEQGDAHLSPKGGTGFGVRTIVRYLERRT